MSDIVVETTTGKVRGLGGILGAAHGGEIPFVFDATSRVENDPRPAIRKLYARLYSGS